MADRWWVNDDADNDANNANNWAATEGGAGGVGVPGAGDDAYMSDTSSSDNCTMSGDISCDNWYMSGTDEYSGNFDIGTHTLTLTDKFDIFGTNTMGDGGKVDCARWAANDGCTLTFHQNSEIECSGNNFLSTLSTQTNSETGKWTQTGSGNCGWWKSTYVWYDVTLNSGNTWTSSSTFMYINAAHNLTMNGDIDTNAQTIIFSIKGDGGGTITLGSGFDLIGTGVTSICFRDNHTFSNNKTGTYSITGGVLIRGFHPNIIGVCGDFSNSNYRINPASYSNPTVTYEAGEVKCKDFKIELDDDTTIDWSAGVTIKPTEDVDFSDNDVHTLSQTGTADIEHIGSSGTRSFDTYGYTIGDLNLNCSGAILEVVTNFSLTKLEGTGGTLRSSVSGTQRTLTASNTGVATGCTFKDISMGSSNKVNAKAATNTNNGNNDGIVFCDTLE